MKLFGLLDWFSWIDRRVAFHRGPALLILNCAKDRERCNCKDPHDPSPPQQSAVYEPERRDSKTTFVISATGMEMRPGKPKYDREKDMQEAHAKVDGFAEPVAPDQPRPGSVIVCAPDGGFFSLDHLDPARPTAPCCPSKRWTSSPAPCARAQTGFLPFFAASPRVRGAKAKYALHKHHQGRIDPVLSGEALKAAGRFKTVWDQVKLPGHFQEPNAVGELAVVLFHGDGQPIGQTRQAVRGNTPQCER